MVKVTLLQHTPDPDLLVATAARLCYSPSDIETIMDNFTAEKVDKFVSLLADLGHESPLEHISFTFGIEGVSRVTEQQLTRHRIASYSIQSGRYVTRDNADFIMPPAIEANDMAREIFLDAKRDSQYHYDGIHHVLKADYIKKGMSEKDAEKKAAEDARYVFLNSIGTKIIVTMNARSLLNFFAHRCCNRAQWEIRNLALQMLLLVKGIAPKVFKNAGANCKALKYCPENNMQCEQFKGLMPTHNDVIELIGKYYRAAD